ncbi:MAG: hypothetical protein R2861_15870 [Desulfobacterales bacterium]
MTDYTDKIKEIAKRVLDEGKVDMVIGFRKGTVPMMNQPHYATSAASVDELIWDSSCGLNLANYLTDKKGNIAIVAKGCDTRNIVTHVIENKIKREQLHIIGVPCTGMIDHHKINAMFDKEITKVEESGDQITISGNGFPRPSQKRPAGGKLRGLHPPQPCGI